MKLQHLCYFGILGLGLLTSCGKTNPKKTAHSAGSSLNAQECTITRDIESGAIYYYVRSDDQSMADSRTDSLDNVLRSYKKYISEKSCSESTMKCTISTRTCTTKDHSSTAICHVVVQNKEVIVNEIDESKMKQYFEDLKDAGACAK